MQTPAFTTTQQETIEEKTSTNFKVLWLFAKVSLQNLEAGIFLWHQQTISESFLSEDFFSNLQKFSPLESFPLYGIFIISPKRTTYNVERQLQFYELVYVSAPRQIRDT